MENKGKRWDEFSSYILQLFSLTLVRSPGIVELLGYVISPW